MTMIALLDRREFLKLGATAAGAGLVLGVGTSCSGETAGLVTFAPDAFIRVGSDGVVSVMVGYSEMGQGITTALPMLVAEELEVDPASVRWEQAPTDAAYGNPLFGGMQGTGGSTTTRAMFEPLRRAGAAAREMLAAAAAEQLGVPRSELTIQSGVVTHGPTGRRRSYGQLAESASRQAVPQDVALKGPGEWRVLGRPQRRLDAAAKVRGEARFGMDVEVPGLLTAVVARCPVFGGRVAGFDAAVARQVPGVRHVVEVRSGVAVVADGYWAAKKGRDALVVRWNEGPNAGLDGAAITRRAAELARREGVVARRAGNAAAALARAARRFEAIYETPYLAHATMEPMNCTAHVRPDACEVWAPTQFQSSSRQLAAGITGLPESAVTVHTTLLGGGFGRRAELDFIEDAVTLSKETGAPVKVIFSREDDVQHDFYRPATYNVLRAGLDAAGMPVAYTHRIVGPSIMARFFPQTFDGMDQTSVEGAADMPYAVPNVLVDWVRYESGVPVGFWRSVGNSQNAFITESFVDELAHGAGQDPVEYRRRLLGGHARYLGVLNLAAQRAGWGSPLPEGRARGVAVRESFGSYVAQVAEVSVGEDGAPRVHRVVCAVDCGTVVNPLTVEAQMESGIVYGLTAALHGEITIERGRVAQSNFHDYALLRLDEMPVIEVHIAPSREAPGGVGEPGTPPIAPAVCNALFALTGRRIRRLPIRAAQLRRG